MYLLKASLKINLNFYSVFTEEQKRKKGLLTCLSIVYGLFLRVSNASTAPTMIIATIMATDIGRKYWSDVDGVWVGAGVAVGAAATMLNVVSALDGQYPLVPEKVA